MTPQPRPRRTLLRAFLGLAVSFFCAVALSAASATKSFNIPAGDAAATLKQFGEQSGFAIMFAPDKVQGVETKGVTGELTPQEALERLLAGYAPGEWLIHGMSVSLIHSVFDYSSEVIYPPVITRLGVKDRGGLIRAEYPEGTMGVKSLALEIVTRAAGAPQKT